MTDPLVRTTTTSIDDTPPIVHEEDSNSSIEPVEFMLTTTDNPYNPFNEFEQWLSFDTSHGYNTCGLVVSLSTLQADSTFKEFQIEQIKTFERIIEFFGEDFYSIVSNHDE